jgi:hypothetical protein
MIVSFTSSMFQSAAGVPVLPLVGAMLGVVALAGLAVFFKPLLSGLVRAGMLMLRPRLTQEQQAARRLMRDTKLIKRTINNAHGISQTAELHAIAARA